MSETKAIKTQAIKKLKEAGLLVKFNRVGPYSDGYTITKPATTLGNTRIDWEVYFGSEEILCDAPTARLYPQNNQWIFQVWQSVPGPGPGDFRETFSSITDAVNVILNYYFGDPSKMNPPELLDLD